MFISPDALTRLVSDHLPLATSARLVRVNTDMHTLLQPTLDKKVKATLAATAGVPDALVDRLFAIFRPLFRGMGAKMQRDTDGTIVSRKMVHTMYFHMIARDPKTRRITFHVIHSVDTDAPLPRVVVTLNHAAAAWGHQAGYSPTSPIPESAWRVEDDPFIAAFVMDSPTAGTFTVRGGRSGEYSDGIEACLRHLGRLPPL